MNEIGDESKGNRIVSFRKIFNIDSSISDLKCSNGEGFKYCYYHPAGQVLTTSTSTTTSANTNINPQLQI